MLFCSLRLGGVPSRVVPLVVRDDSGDSGVSQPLGFGGSVSVLFKAPPGLSRLFVF